MKFNSNFSNVVVTVEQLTGYWSDTIGQTAETMAMFENICLSLYCNDGYRNLYVTLLNKFKFSYHCVMISTYF